MTALLFQAVHDSLRTLLADPKYLGAQPGLIAALHTWSQTLMLHPHVHCLVTGGGRTSDGSWKAVRNGFLLPRPRVYGGVWGQVAGRDPTGLRARSVGPARADAAAAVHQPLEPPGSPDEDAVECADYGALSARGGRRVVF